MQSALRLHVVVHVPIVFGSSLVHERPIGQPLRPSPTVQPARHWRLPVSQTRPDVAPPQSASRMQPQTPVRHALPAPLAMQLAVLLSVHCTQRLELVSQSERPSERMPQWPSLRHSTQADIPPASRLPTRQ
jgi:hypothetical protein